MSSKHSFYVGQCWDPPQSRLQWTIPFAFEQLRPELLKRHTSLRSSVLFESVVAGVTEFRQTERERQLYNRERQQFEEEFKKVARRRGKRRRKQS